MTVHPRPRREVASRFLKVGGRVTHYLDAGDGPPLLLLHGGEFGAGAEVTWDRSIAALSRTRRVIAPDLLGFGRSDKVRDMVDPRGSFVAQIRDVLDALCIDEVDVVGTSLSARLVLDVAAEHPPAWPVRSIVAVGLGLHPPAPDVRAALAAFDGSEASMRPILHLLFHDRDVADDPDQLARRMELALLPGAWQFGRAAGLGRPVGAPRPPRTAAVSYEGIDRPVLLVVGAHDAIVPQEDVEALASQIPDAQRSVVPDAGHYPQVERPEATVELIDRFLGASSAQPEVIRRGA